MKYPFFSIITPVYNNRETIERTIKSVINQNFSSYEYILIDSMSDDGTEKIIEKYSSKIDIIVREEDEGVFDAMNKGIGLSSGVYIGIINSDDLYKKRALKKVYKKVKKGNPNVVYSNIEREAVGKGVFKVKSKESIDLYSFRYEMPIKHASSFVKKSLYESSGMYDTDYPIAADFELMLRFCRHGAEFGYIDDELALMRAGGMSSKTFPKGRFEALRALRNHNVPAYIRFMFYANLLKDITKRKIISKLKKSEPGKTLIKKINKVRYK